MEWDAYGSVVWKLHRLKFQALGNYLEALR